MNIGKIMNPSSNNYFLRALSIGSITIVLLSWYLLTENKIIPSLYLPHPYRVLETLITLQGDFLRHVFATLYRILFGYSIGTGLGFLLGLMMGYNRYFFAIINPIIESWRPVPAVALVPFFVLWFGFSEAGKIILVALGCLLIIVVNTLEAINNVKPIYIRAASSFGASQWQIFTKIITPIILPEIRSGARISLAISITLVVVSEFMGASYGIGYMMNLARITFSTHAILCGTITLGLVSASLDRLLQCIFDLSTGWAEKAKETII